MTRGTWIVIIIVLIMILVGLGVVYRGPIMDRLGGSQSAQEATTTQEQAPQWQTYATSTYSIEYPPGYTLNASYAYDQFGPNKPIEGVSFTIPAEMATGTNLGSDTRLSVEQLPRAKNCTADIFIPADVTATSYSDNGVTYSLATTTDAGAGNRYEEDVYAIPGSSPCTAVRYFIHYSVIENYPAGTVQEFDRTQLLSDFDQMRQSLTLGSAAPAAQ